MQSFRSVSSDLRQCFNKDLYQFIMRTDKAEITDRKLCNDKFNYLVFPQNLPDIYILLYCVNMYTNNLLTIHEYLPNQICIMIPLK